MQVQVCNPYISYNHRQAICQVIWSPPSRHCVYDPADANPTFESPTAARRPRSRTRPPAAASTAPPLVVSSSSSDHPPSLPPSQASQANGSARPARSHKARTTRARTGPPPPATSLAHPQSGSHPGQSSTGAHSPGPAGPA
ncbi:hypothetical protein BVRB_7g176830 [Beta vulgaris subsp. vulgaris]|nr:hypothetical protein BVRB_7g176830 [Beta vulgaris subsp. vulgaris]